MQILRFNRKIIFMLFIEVKISDSIAVFSLKIPFFGFLSVKLDKAIK